MYRGTFPSLPLHASSLSTKPNHRVYRATAHQTSHFSQPKRAGFKGPMVHSSESYKRFGGVVVSVGRSTNFGSGGGSGSGNERGEGKAGKGTRRVLVVGGGKSAQEYVVFPDF